MNRLRKVLVTPPNFDEEAAALLRAHGCEAIVPDAPESAFSEDALAALLADKQGWIIGPHANVTRSLVARAPSCLVFARRGVGYERLDVEAIRGLGRLAAIAAGGNDDSVADHVVGLMLAVGRRMREQQAAMIAGDSVIRISTDLFQKTVGIVGLGRTGRTLARRLRGFDVRILAFSPRPDREFCGANGIVCADMETLLRTSDYVSLHAPLTPQTRHMIGAAELAMMHPHAFLINAGRGGLVDDAALLEALRGKIIAGAGLDCLEAENDPACAGTARELVALPNVVATPHSAASTREGLARTNLVAARIVALALSGGAVPPECIVADGRGA